MNKLYSFLICAPIVAVYMVAMGLISLYQDMDTEINPNKSWDPFVIVHNLFKK